MKQEGCPFKGVLYFGLILTEKGPEGTRVQCSIWRSGDPGDTSQVKTDLIDIFMAVIDEELDEIDIQWEDNAAVCVILASGGYPGDYKKGYEIFGLEALEDGTDTLVFHAGTIKKNGKYYTNGGRVLGITAVSENLDKAIEKVYEKVKLVSFTDMYYRKDIGIK